MLISNSSKTIKEAFSRQWQAIIIRIMGISSPDIKVSRSPLNYACSQTLHQKVNGISDTKLKENWSSVHSHLASVAKPGAREGPALAWHDGMWAFGTHTHPPHAHTVPQTFRDTSATRYYWLQGKGLRCHRFFYKLFTVLALPASSQSPLTCCGAFHPLTN